MPDTPSRSQHASLTETYCPRIKPAKDAIVDYYDTRLANLSLRVTPPSKRHRNGLLTWRFGYRHNGKPGIVTIGRYPAWTAAAALLKARKLQVMIDEGQDPREVLRPRPAPAEAAPIDTVNAMYARYEPELDGRSDRHRLAVTSYFQRFVLPTLGERDIHSVTRREIVDLLKTVKAASGPISANRCSTAISAWFTFLVRDGVLESSPAAKLPKSEERPREQSLTVPQLVRIWQAADKLGGPTGNPAGRFIQLLIATATRRDESAKLPRAEVDGDMWLLPANRNKSGRNFLIPLSTLAMGVLNACPNTGPYYFSRTGRRPLSGLGDAKKALDAEIADQSGPPLPRWVFHDLRRSIATHLAALGVSQSTIEKVLNHALPKLGATYNKYSYRSEVGEALQTWAHHFTAALAGAPEAPVLALEEAAE